MDAQTLLDLHGKTALVTGASRGIGLATAQLLAGCAKRRQKRSAQTAARRWRWRRTSAT
jgi:NAD(P)-dependent dehydrogenase (short-subunit alcohol dehydrogenase family)